MTCRRKSFALLACLTSLALATGALGCGDGKPHRKSRVRAASEAALPAQDAGDDSSKQRKDKGDKDAGKKADKRTHDHTANPGEVCWLVTMHGEHGKPQGVWGVTGEGNVKGPVNQPLADGPGGPAPHSMRGLTPLPDGGFLAVNAFMKDTRILRFGPKDAQGQYPFVGNFTVLGPANPAMVHAYQMAIGADGQVYVSNQDSNTVTRYVGVGQPNAGQPLSPPVSMSHLADLRPGVIVPNAKTSPEGLVEVRGIAFGPDGLLYACDRSGSRVSGYDTTTGRRVKVLADESHGLKHPIQVLFASDGQTAYIGDNGTDSIYRVKLADGSVDTFVKKGDADLKAPSGLALKGEWLYVGSREGKQILRFELKDGKADDKPVATLPDKPEFLMWVGD
ncbi:MAG: hypothetical protein FJ292_05445 [Planctomycetes bacterium]|nr:hypothetical protein [Planctomycetota bacterium]